MLTCSMLVSSMLVSTMLASSVPTFTRSLRSQVQELTVGTPIPTKQEYLDLLPKLPMLPRDVQITHVLRRCGYFWDVLKQLSLYPQVPHSNTWKCLLIMHHCLFACIEPCSCIRGRTIAGDNEVGFRYCQSMLNRHLWHQPAVQGNSGSKRVHPCVSQAFSKCHSVVQSLLVQLIGRWNAFANTRELGPLFAKPIYTLDDIRRRTSAATPVVVRCSDAPVSLQRDTLLLLESLRWVLHGVRVVC